MMKQTSARGHFCESGSRTKSTKRPKYRHRIRSLAGTVRKHQLCPEIKSAIHLLLWELHGQNQDVSNSLAQSYVYLAQFVDDTEAETVARGQAVLQSSDLDPEELIYADQAVVIINRIKVEMENLMQDIKTFLP